MFKTTLSQTISKGLIQEVDVANLASEYGRLAGEGQRLLTFYVGPGRSIAESSLTLVLLGPGGSLAVRRAYVEAKGHFRSLVPEHPCFHVFEREIYEQTGITAHGNPWLKPVRFPLDSPLKLEEYPFFSIEGKEIHEVGVGPVHAGVIEPGHFRFMCFGETVHHLEIQLGYQHRGVEALLREQDPRCRGVLIESVAGDSAVAHATAYSIAIEKICEKDVGMASTLVRGIANELERIAMHLAGLAGLATDIAYLPGASVYGRLRTAVINTSMRLSGSRFGRCWIRPGGVRQGIDCDQAKDIATTLAKVRRDAEIINGCMFTAKTVRHRLKGTGHVTQDLAQKLGLVGMIARSSGVPIDLRRLKTKMEKPGSIKMSEAQAGDCMARALLRRDEILESIDWIILSLKNWLDISASIKELKHFAPECLVVSGVEGWRGEVIHCLETDKNGAVINYRIQDPSLRNWFGLAQAVRSNAISDFPICNKSFDLSYCGNDL